MWVKYLFLDTTLKIYRLKSSCIYIKNIRSQTGIRLFFPLPFVIYNNSLYVFFENEKINLFLFKNFQVFLKKFLFNLKFYSVQSITMQGIGLRSLGKHQFVVFKLGYCHNCVVYLDSFFQLRHEKFKNSFMTVSRNFLNNIINLIVNLKKPDIYKCSGLLIEGKKYKIKIGKKE